MKRDIITVVGSVNYDILLNQDRLPQIGETYFSNGVNIAGGGKGANQAVQASKLGAETYFVGAIGNDYFGGFLKNELVKYGVNIDNLKVVDETTGLGVINGISNGTVAATIFRGANFAITRNDIDNVEDLIKDSKIVILQMEIPIEIIEYTVNKASQFGCYIILNGAPAVNIDSDILKLVDCFIVNEVEASYYSKSNINNIATALENCKKLYNNIKEILIITLGENGSIIYDGNNTEIIPAIKANVVETTGAGDSYIGAMASKLVKGFSIVDAAKFGSLAAAYTVSKIGAQSSMPYLHDIVVE